MKEIIVATGASKCAGLMERYTRQLQKAEIPALIVTLPAVCANDNLGDLNQKIAFMRSTLLDLKGYRKIVFTDAWDVLFYGSADELIAKVPDNGVVLCAERVCWPEESMAAPFTAAGDWRYVNGGCLAGSYDALCEWVESLSVYCDDYGTYVDQLLLNRLRAVDSALTPIDSQTDLFYTVTQKIDVEQQSVPPDLVVKDGRPFNTLTGKFPNFIHFCAKRPADDFLQMMGES